MSTDSSKLPSYPMPPNLSTLPPELLDNILIYISLDTGYQPPDDAPPPWTRSQPADSIPPPWIRTLSALSATCRRLRLPALKGIYSKLNLVWTTWTDPPIVLLLRTMLCSPEVAAIVREVNLVGWTVVLRTCRRKPDWVLEESKLGVGSLFTSAEVQMLVDWMTVRGIGSGVESGVTPGSLDMPEENDVDWHAAIFTRNDCDAITSILLSLLPNLHTLHMDVDYTYLHEHPVFLYKLLSLRKPISLSPSPLLPNLRTIKFCTLRYSLSSFIDTFIESQDTCPDTHVLPFITNAQHNFPNLTTLDLVVANIIPLTIELDTPRCNTLKSLTLTTFNTSTLRGLLTLCPKVEILRYKLQRQLYFGADFQTSDLSELRDAIELCADTLRSVSIVHEWYGRDGTQDGMISSGEWENRLSELRDDDPSDGGGGGEFGYTGGGGGLLPFHREMVKLERLCVGLTVLLGMQKIGEIDRLVRGTSRPPASHEQLGFNFPEIIPPSLKELWIHRKDDSYIWRDRYYDSHLKLLVGQLVSDTHIQRKLSLENLSYPRVSWYPNCPEDDDIELLFSEEGYLQPYRPELTSDIINLGREAGITLWHNEGEKVVGWEGKRKDEYGPEYETGGAPVTPSWSGMTKWHLRDSREHSTKEGLEDPRKGLRFETYEECGERLSRLRNGEVEGGDNVRES
ncbi:hypothetical protein DFH27DRAFT_552930 [Peziza echinospora]|nr:hypothetical protein DFH27DRAFT_552930 [Peziza echinospora]